MKKKALTSQNVYGNGLPFQNNNKRGPTARALLSKFEGLVYALVQRTANKFADTKLRLYRKVGKGAKAQKSETLLPSVKRKLLLDGRTRFKHFVSGSEDVAEVESHDVLRFLARPNEQAGQREHAYYHQAYLEVVGISYWRLHYEKGATPSGYHLLAPEFMKPVTSETGEVTKWLWGVGGNEEEIPAEEVLVDRYPDLLDPYGVGPGMSPTRSVFAQLNLQERALSTLAAVLRHQGRPSLLIAPKGDLAQISEQDTENLKRRVQEFERGGSGNVAVADQDITVTPLDYKPTDLATIQIDEHLIELCCYAFGMPVMLLKGIEGGSRAAYETALQEWIDGAINARLRDYETFLNHRLLPMFEGDDSPYFFCFDDPSPSQDAEQAKTLTTLVEGGIVLRNEARSALGYEPVEGGDELLIHSKYRSPSLDDVEDEEAPLDIETAKLANVFIQQVASGLLPRDSGKGQLVALGIKDARAESMLGSAGKEKKPEPQAVGIGTNDKPTNQPPAPPKEEEPKPKKLIIPESTKALAPIGKVPLEGRKKLEDILAKHFRKWATSIIGQIEKRADNITTKGLPDQFIPLADWTDELADEVKPVIEIFFEDGGEKLLQRIGASDEVFEVFNPKAKQYAETASIRLSDETLATTTKAVNEALQETRAAVASNLEHGNSIADLTKKLKEIFDGAETYRAKRIAQTESSTAWHNGLQQAAVESGVVREFEWLTSSEPCPECAELNGKRIPLDGKLAPLHPMCECSALEILDIQA